MAVEIVDGCKDHGGGGRGRGRKGQKYEEHEWNVFKGGPSPPSPFGISFPPRGHSGEEISLRGGGQSSIENIGRSQEVGEEEEGHRAEKLQKKKKNQQQCQ